MTSAFHREYLIQLPLPLAQLYNRAHNAKDPRNRHDNAYYLFEALVKLMATPLVAAYLHEIRHGGKRVDVIDWRLQQLALPSLGQWVGIVRELAKHFGTHAETTSHPLAHLWGQLMRQYRDKPGLVGLYQRIKHGADGNRAGDRSCSILQVLEALVPYRNGVFGHGAVRFESFYAQDMGPLLFPALNEILADEVLAPIGPPGSRLIYLHEVRAVSEETMEISFRDLVGYQGEWGAPMLVGREEAKDLIPRCVAVLWPGQRLPLRLDPLLRYRETDLDAEVLFLNRDHDAHQVEYLSYTTGRTERDAAMERAMARLLSLITAQPMTEERLAELEAQSLTATPPEETAPEPPPAPVVQLGDYDILAEIGRGGMGVVYLARQLSLGRLVALKMLPDSLARDPVALARFQREMRALASCDHPNIMKVLTHGTMPDGRLYYTMEYVPGADLEQIWSELKSQTGTAPASRLGSTTLAQAVHTASDKHRQATASRYQSGAPAGAAPLSGSSVPSVTETHDTTSEGDPRIPRLPLPPLPPLPSKTADPGSYVRSIVTLMRDVALALQAVHEQGILHRDVKPANLMLTPDGSRVVLMDFGLAKGQDTTLAASHQGGLLGTLRYAAPEQLAYPRVEISPATDVYGLGVTMWELLTRRRLFQGAEDEKQLAMLMHNSDVPRMRTVDPSVDRDLDAIVARATERRMSDRIKTAGQLAEYLQLYLDSKPLPFLQPSLPEKCWRWVRRHKRAVAAGVTGVMLLSAIAAGVWYWDAYQRPSVAYYTTVITRNGLPEGVGRLTDEQVGHRNSSLAFHQHGRRGLVHEIRVVNSRGAYPPVTMHTNLFALGSLNPLPQERIDAVPEALAVSRVAFERDARGHILNQIAYNRAGRPLYTLHYVLPDQAEYKDEAIARAVSESGISLLKFVRLASGPEAGRTKEVRFFDSAGKPQPSRDGIYGVQYGFDAGWLPVEQIYLGADGQPAVTKEGIAKATLTYDALGNPTQVAFVGRDGQAVVTKEGVAGMQLAYDSYGNLQEVVFVGTDGQLATMRGIGAAGRSFRYDAHGNVVETTFFDAHRHLVTGGRGEQQVAAYARRTVEWDAHGRTLETYFDPDGNPIVVGGRVVKTRAVWDPRGYLMEASFFDEHERPICDHKGCAKRRITRDTHGNVAEESCLDETDHSIRSAEGQAFFKQVHDDRGNVIEESYFGPSGQPERYDEHHVKMRFTYNAQGKHVAAAFFDATEQPIKNKEGYAKVTFSYNLHGNLTEVAFFDEQVQPIMRKGGAARLRRTYNAHDQLIAETLYDQHGHPTRHENGYVTQQLVYDARGYRIETAHFDEDDHPTVSTDGYAKEQIKYNDHGQVEEVALVGLDGGYALHTKYGFAKVRRTYNERGQDAQWMYVDALDSPVQITNGYATIRFTYDALGRATTRLFFDVHGVPVHTRVTIQKVEPDCVSQRLGLQVGDILVSYDGEDLRDARIFREWELVKGERRRELRLQRRGKTCASRCPQAA